MDYQNERDVARAIALEVGALLTHYSENGFEVEEKTPGDPVTIADREASELIVDGLLAAFPEDGILSEELADSARRLRKRRVWIVDPIDGTREYVKGTGDYVVSIGLVVDGQPVLGVIYAPARGDLYEGVVGQGVWKNGETAGFSARPLEQAVVSVSDTEHERTLHRYTDFRMSPSGSIAYKLAKVAAGESDATFTMNPRSEWDIAAGAALVAAAGGVLTTRGGEPIAFNQPQPRLRRGLIGGRPEVVSDLEGVLARLGIPEKRLWLTDEDNVWAALPEAFRARAAAGAQLHATAAGLRPLAWTALEEQDGWSITHAEGDAALLDELVRDLQREYGALAWPQNQVG
ncbi:myo-inositol-1(or 4)-monophosphatase [Deinobacterium chartae]|uniref:Myo-inositol-1(Or 4)-monophosphatase n=1 Tax=Deinobacterium chartae TaxID=521158 RepID=A0A841I3D9_9DEIO|nr:myo-inositol-1(or 4)-monophosphatase [Deinobacterium chartae]